MKLRAIDLDGYGAPGRRRFSFVSDISILYECDGSGRSDVWDALAACMGGMPPDDCGGGTGEPWGIMLEFTDDDGQVRILNIRRDSSDGALLQPEQPLVRRELRDLMFIPLTPEPGGNRCEAEKRLTELLTTDGCLWEGKRALAALSDRLSRKKDEASALAKSVQHLRERLNLAETASSELPLILAESDRLKSELDEVCDRIAALEKTLSAWRTRTDEEHAKKKEAERLKAEKARLAKLSRLEKKMAEINRTIGEFDRCKSGFEQGSMERLEELEGSRNKAAMLVQEKNRELAAAKSELDKARRQLRNVNISLENTPVAKYEDSISQEVESLSSDVGFHSQAIDTIDKSLKNFKAASRRKAAAAIKWAAASIAAAIAAGSAYFAFPAFGGISLGIGGILSVSAFAAAAVLCARVKGVMRQYGKSLGERREIEAQLAEETARLQVLLDGETLDEYNDNRRRLQKLRDMKIASEHSVAAAEHNLESTMPEAAEALLAEAESRIGEFLSKAGCQTSVEYKAKWVEYWAAVNGKIHLEREIKKLTETPAGSGVGDAGGVDADIPAVQEELNNLVEKRASLNPAYAHAVGRMEQLRLASKEDRWSIAAELMENEEKLSEFELQISAIGEAMETLQKVLDESGFCDAAGNLLASATDGRYNGVRRADGKTADIQVLDAESGTWRSVEDLGLCDNRKVRLILVCALLDHYDPMQLLPAVVADPFTGVSVDGSDSICDFIDRFRRSRQVIVFARQRGLCDEAEDLTCIPAT